MNQDTRVGRRNAGRIDHVLLLYRNRQNQDDARLKLTELLGIDDWDDVGEGDEGIYIWMAAHGEGFYCLVFGVSDLDRAVENVKRVSGRSPHLLGAAPSKVYEKFDIAREAIVGTVVGIRLMLGEFAPKDP
jgi:hypothetical protein